MATAGPPSDSDRRLAGARDERRPGLRDERPSGLRDKRRADPRRALGAVGEEIACQHLQRRDFAILQRNVRTRHGEIDIIARDKRALLFVEVKTRRARSGALRGTRAQRPGAAAQSHSEPPCRPFDGPAIAPLNGLAIAPLDSLSRRQRSRLRRLAAAWLQSASPRLEVEIVRFDAIGVLLDERDRLLRLDHIEGAW